MADISKEIQNFKEARKGKEVRNSMISLAEKVNSDGEKALEDVAAQVGIIQAAVNAADNAVTIAHDAVKRADDTLGHADAVLHEATAQADNSAGSAVLSRSWAEGGTAIREDEDINNSKYHSQQARNEADRAKQEAERSTTEADRAAQYANIIAPGFCIDADTMTLYVKVGVGVDFEVFDDNVLCWKVS